MGRRNPGGGLVFGGNGPRDFVEIPDSESLDLVEGLTVEMWLYLEAWSTAGGTGATKELAYKVGTAERQEGPYPHDHRCACMGCRSPRR